MTRQLAKYVASGSFAQLAMEACFNLSTSDGTRKSYWLDLRHWISFCDENGVDPTKAIDTHVNLWIESMKRAGLASNTRYRRMCGCSAVYDRLRRKKLGGVIENPFSIADGPKREKALRQKPTPIADVDAVSRALQLCQEDHTPAGIRDVALIRLLWATGARRSSLSELTFERLEEVPGDLVTGYLVTSFRCTLPQKGGKEVQLWISGAAKSALASWIALLRGLGINSGSIFLLTRRASTIGLRPEALTPMKPRDIWRAVRRRGRLAKVTLSPHQFRVAFLTLNPAKLEERQDAAGHADPATTRLYDREWRGRAAFEQMPEIESLVAKKPT